MRNALRTSRCSYFHTVLAVLLCCILFLSGSFSTKTAVAATENYSSDNASSELASNVEPSTAQTTFVAAAETKNILNEDRTNPRTVRVGYIDSPGAFTRNETGNCSGYTYDYLVQIAQYTGWSYEFIEAVGDTENDRAVNLLAMLDKGEVDIEGAMTYSEAYAELYAYPKNSYGSVQSALFVPNGSSNLTQTNLFTHSKLRVAVYQKAGKRREELEYFCEQNDIKLTVLEYETSSEMEDAVLTEAADALLDVDLNVREGFHLAATFAARPYFFASPLSSRDIADEIDQAIEHINESDPSLQMKLYNKYFAKPDESFTLTQSELEYARNHSPLQVGIISDKAPIQSFDDETGEVKGATRDMLDYLEKRAGFTFEIVRIEHTDDPAQAIIDADVDLVAGVDSSNRIVFDSYGFDHGLRQAQGKA